MISPLTYRRKVQDLSQHHTQNTVLPVVVSPILITAVISVFIAMAEPLAEVVVVSGLIFVIPVVTEIGVLVGIAVTIVVVPSVFPIGSAGFKALLVAVIHRPPQQVCAILVYLVIRPGPVVSINRRRIEVGIGIVIKSRLAETILLLAEALQIISLKTILGHSALLLQIFSLPLQADLVCLDVPTVLCQPNLLLLNQLLLPLL